MSLEAIWLVNRDLLPLLQANPGLPASAEPLQERHRDTDLLRHHRLHAHQPMDRQEADLAHLRDDLLVLRRHGGPGGVAQSHREVEKAGRIIGGWSVAGGPLRFTLRAI